ncbi:exopolyphosphatase [Bacillus manliponensis]|uniref:Ppx/GppA phosphatase family protein n=1 Tax=Bacillus manliponensis TaxID=574376 RepID=UPI0035196489
MKRLLKQQYGIIDIGSNTMRLVIYEKQEGGAYKEIENTKVVARLRNYLIKGSLIEEGIHILLRTLLQFQESTRFHKLSTVLCVATATIRQAQNQSTIKQLVEEKTDFTLRILSEYEEARYGYMAVVNSTPFTEGMIVDIGGGSTEVTYFKNREIVAYHSFPFGALSLRKQFVYKNMPTSEELEELRRYLWYQFQTLPWLKGKKLPLIAIGGSARNMVNIHQNLISYPISGLHLYKMAGKDIEDVKKHILKLSFAELQKLEGLAKDRADTIIPAIEVFDMLVDITEASSFVLSRKGLREGVFYEELTSEFGISYYPNIIEESIYLLSHAYEMDMGGVVKVLNISTKICRELERCGIASFTTEDWSMLYRAAKVFNIGKYIDNESSSQHTYYLLANKTIDGMLHKERVRLALIASYKSKMLFKQYIKPFEGWFDKNEQTHMRLLGAILQLAAAMNVTNRDMVDAIRMMKYKDELIVNITCKYVPLAERIQAEKQKKQLEKVIKMNIELRFVG